LGFPRQLGAWALFLLKPLSDPSLMLVGIPRGKGKITDPKQEIGVLFMAFVGEH